MTEFWQYVISGFSTGAIYALVALGLLEKAGLSYRTTQFSAQYLAKDTRNKT